MAEAPLGATTKELKDMQTTKKRIVALTAGGALAAAGIVAALVLPAQAGTTTPTTVTQTGVEDGTNDGETADDATEVEGDAADGETDDDATEVEDGTSDGETADDAPATP
ncbi:hypothetical protein Cch01nite_07670 [Cellulomonas chitinilytica]|uniref:Uncharacterized protein n=2 Tax=Cellulomonas chitinilytica TaxID=398759 RepID=A0A919NYM5_9CELL|nr:hypothetical protein Cch01nite_07670 [Cellulomonas chitinilytica]